MSCLAKWTAIFVLILSGACHGQAMAGAGPVVFVDAAGASEARRLHPATSILELPGEVLARAAQLTNEIDAGALERGGSRAREQIAAFSQAILAADPDIFERPSAVVITTRMLPIEMVRKGDAFLGDVVQIAHRFPGEGAQRAAAGKSSAVLPMSRYVLEAIIGMPEAVPRIDQDIIKVALSLDREIAVEVALGGGLAHLKRTLQRDDVGILHIDTHGGPEGRTMQVARDGATIAASELPVVRVPVVLLFGCEGARGREAVGARLEAQGAGAVISAFAKFNSFGLTGDPRLEEHIYRAFFGALREGKSVGRALLEMRQAALRENPAPLDNLTRLLFVLIGRGDIRFDWPSGGKR